MTSGNASKLRGALTWLDTGLDGRVCRGALSALVARQYYEQDESVKTGSSLDLSLGFLEAAVRHQVVRAVPITLEVKKPVLVYTDAAAEATGVRIGAMVIAPGQPTEVLVYDPPGSGRPLGRGRHHNQSSRASCGPSRGMHDARCVEGCGRYLVHR